MELVGQQQCAVKELCFYLWNLLPNGKGVLSRAKDRIVHHLEAKRALDSLNHILVKQCSTTEKFIFKQKSGFVQYMKMKPSVSPKLKHAVYSSATDFFQPVFNFDLV